LAFLNRLPFQTRKPS